MLDTAVIPCGGFGTRLQPVTRWLPKELLPVGLRPGLHWALDEIADARLQRAILFRSPLEPALESSARTWQGPPELEFVPQQRPRGLGDAFLHARDALEGEPFAAILPEFLFRGPNPTSAVVDAHRGGGRAAALVAPGDGRPPPDQSAARPAVVRETSAGLRVTDVEVGTQPPQRAGGRPGLARRGQLAAVDAEAAWYQAGLPEGYRSAVADFPARV